MKLNIITPVSRPDNLRAIWDSVRFKPSIEWWMVFDVTASTDIVTEIEKEWAKWTNLHCFFSRKNALAGHAHRNGMLGWLSNTPDWVMSLDDDNILHPDLIPWLEANNKLLENYEVVIFDQVNKDGAHRLTAHPDNVKPNCIDTAQYMWRGRAAEGIRYREDLYNADGYFIKEVYQRNKDKTLFVNQPLCYYNYLRS